PDQDRLAGLRRPGNAEDAATLLDEVAQALVDPLRGPWVVRDRRLTADHEDLATTIDPVGTFGGNVGAWQALLLHRGGSLHVGALGARTAWRPAAATARRAMVVSASSAPRAAPPSWSASASPPWEERRLRSN